MSAAPDRNQPSEASLPRCPSGLDPCPVVAEVAALRSQLADLAEQVRTDRLTGLGNYRFFRQALDQELERTQRSLQPTALIMLDVDFFKQVNDRHGHDIGNRALVHLAGLLGRTLRRLDIPCRYGGEEFAVILPDSDLAAALQVAERVRRVIAETPLQVAGTPLSLTASLGVATCSIGHPRTAEQLIRDADRHLYRAKKTGRNRVCHPPLPPADRVSREERQALSSLFGNTSAQEDSES